jgi:hypothetical protein
LNSIGCLYLMVTSQPKKAAFESLPKAELREAIQHSLSRSVRAYYRYTFFTGVTGILMNTVYYVLRLAHLLDRMRNRLSRFREALFAYGYEIGTPSLSNSQLSVIGHRSTDRCWRWSRLAWWCRLLAIVATSRREVRHGRRHHCFDHCTD